MRHCAMALQRCAVAAMPRQRAVEETLQRMPLAGMVMRNFRSCAVFRMSEGKDGGGDGIKEDDDATPIKDDKWLNSPRFSSPYRPGAKFGGKFSSSVNSISDADNWGGMPSSVSDYDSWALEKPEMSPGAATEKKLVEGLQQEDPGGRWEENYVRMPMGEQRRKPFRHAPNINISLDEAWGRTSASGRLVPRPDRIVLVRHGESQGNSDDAVYTKVSDWRISLTRKGKEQGRKAGQELRKVVGDGDVFFYYSPYYRTVETCQQIMDAFDVKQVRGMREEPRMAEQQFGNLQNLDAIRKSKNERHMYGRFFYRFPNGEAGLDVYNRVTSFISTLRRDHVEEGCTPIIITHGLALRLFLMAWFQWTVEEFETTQNPHNCGIAVMERIPGEDRYRLTQPTCEMLGCDALPSTSTEGGALRTNIDAWPDRLINDKA
eukprot:CAMPEP_0181290370 /NCGR_PEP_ID=MMETSP1101-20121128/1377_1 /TAXON_ID=46948 /ORGANISM="Rhodomonas abbreviata, Strain Caron Lab Isolate" /LENGTH=431 /DNA_ID=CAMNT_0023394649 /DNA_START=132 /DNA_END=1423 /DNA_ORIENTATION=+